MGKIKKDTSLMEITKKYPKAIQVLIKYGFHCTDCPVAMLETIEQGARVHGIDLEKLLQELNQSIK